MSSSHPNLRVDWCSYEAAKYAVTTWHYSHTMPKSKNAYLGVWEQSEFIGALVYSLGSGRATDGRGFGLQRSFEVVELARVALRSHVSPVSRILAISVRLLRREFPKLRLIVSYADPRHGHVGPIYQATNWLYVGPTSPSRAFVDALGREHHSRVVSHSGVNSHFGQSRHALRTQDAIKIIRLPGKHRYLYPLDPEIATRIRPLAKPYPKRAKDSSEPSPVHGEEDGAAPIRTLQTPLPLTTDSRRL